MTVGFGFLIALDEPPLDLRGSSWLVPIAQALVAIPFVVRIDDAGAARDRPAPARGRGDARRIAGAASGARSTCRSSRARCSSRPGSRSRSRSASSAPPSSSCGPTPRRCPCAIFRLLGRPGPLNFGAAMAASVILMGLTVVAVLGIERFRVGSVGDVLMLRLEQVTVAYDGFTAVARRSTSRSPTARSSACSVRAGAARARCCGPIAGLGARRDRAGVVGRRRPRRRPAAPARLRADVPGPRAVPAPRRRSATSRSACACSGGHAPRSTTRTGAALALRRPRRVRAPARHRAVGRRAAARRARPRAGARSRAS